MSWRLKIKSFRISQQTETKKKNEKILIGYYGFWVILTYASAASAFAGMYFAFNGSIRNALICLMFSGLCDGIDGKVASIKKRNERQKSYGVQIDALSDLVSFGVLPAVIGLMLISHYDSGISTFLNISVMIVFILAALIRLAYFNVIEAELISKNEKRKYYEGLPVTSVALIIPFVYSLCDIIKIPLSAIYSILLLLISLAFVLKIKIPKPRGRSIILLLITGLPTFFYLIFFASN